MYKVVKFIWDLLEITINVPDTEVMEIGILKEMEKVNLLQIVQTFKENLQEEIIKMHPN